MRRREVWLVASLSLACQQGAERGERAVSATVRSSQPGGDPTGIGLMLTLGDQELQYWGVPHRYDPDDPVLLAVERRWEGFASAHPPGSACVAVEGRPREGASSRTEAIRLGGGEGGLVSWLATQGGYRVVTFEPETRWLFSQQAQHFGHEPSCHAYLLRGVSLWQARRPQEPLPIFLEELWPWESLGCDPSMDAIAEAYLRLHGGELSRVSEDELARMLDPVTGGTDMARVMARDALLRDAHMVEGLAASWREGQSLFVVLGQAHLEDQELALRSRLVHERAASVQLEE